VTDILPTSLLVAYITDYFCLAKTRLLLTSNLLFRGYLTTGAVVLGDIVATTVLFVFMNVLFFALLYFVVVASAEKYEIMEVKPWVWSAESLMDSFQDDSFVPLRVLYVAALITSAWLWLYLIVAYVLRSFNLVPVVASHLGKMLDFQDHPVQTIGYFVAAFAAVTMGVGTFIWTAI
jgi:hypothetical protein